MTLKHILTAAAVTATVAATAQSLSREVVIDREITPVVRPVVRPALVSPTLLPSKVETQPLSVYEYFGTAEITRSVATLAPVEWADSVMRSPYRGYASAGYFPALNIGAAAGYRFVRDSRRDIGAHISFDTGDWDGVKGSESKYSATALTLGADARLVFAPGTLTAAAGYTFSSTTPAMVLGQQFDRGKQAINHVDVDALWKPARTGILDWNAKARFGFGGFTQNKTTELAVFARPDGKYVDMKPVSDVTFGVGTDLALRLGKKDAIALGIDADFRHVGTFNMLVPMTYTDKLTDESLAGVFVQPYGSHTEGIVALRPGYTFRGGVLSGRLGVRIDVATGGMQSGNRIAPDIHLDVTAPSGRFALFLHATGGDVMNTNYDLWQRNPWMAGAFCMERSHVDADIQAGVTFGQYKGVWVTVNAGWSSASDWAVPVAIRDVNTWLLIDRIKGFNFGIEAGYAWKDMVSVTAHATGVTHRGYYRWQDNAKWAFDIAAKVRPWGRLQVEAGYAVRTGRQGYVIGAKPSVGDFAAFTTYNVALGHTSNLFAGAEYEFTDAFGVFLKCENLLNRRWYVTNNIRSRGIHGLAGLQFKF